MFCRADDAKTTFGDCGHVFQRVELDDLYVGLKQNNSQSALLLTANLDWNLGRTKNVKIIRSGHVTLEGKQLKSGRAI